MWYISESLTRPQAIDESSSKKYIYVRRHITEETRTDEAGDNYTIYVYEESKVPKDVHILLIAQAEQNTRLDDIEDAITELIGGEG